ncbi:hypothetical protein EmuJ_000185400 [Echinococcus multilocularis]|uniref:Uncharacterized protein n=1 Tax=Echinococcus multilocularis TaxID=6211 RepID=A0A087W087_ECHMU|nr:hypothetical protein EmuJ_000185400 [Echinococcus multilocularis]
MIYNRLLLLICTFVICALQMASTLPASAFRPTKASTALNRLEKFVCVRKADLETLQSMTSAEWNMVGYPHKRGPEILFEVE